MIWGRTPPDGSTQNGTAGPGERSAQADQAAWLAREVARLAEDNDRLRVALEEIHYLYGDRAGALMHGLRHLLGRARPTAMEVRLLLGLARQVRWYVRHGEEPAPDKA